jgi:MFS family permease
LILASFAAMSLLSPYVWGRLSDRLGRRKPVLVGGLIGLLLAYALLSRASTINAAWAARLLEGLGLAAYMTASLALMGDLLSAEQKRGQRMGTYRGMGSFAFATGAIVGGYVADHYSLRLSFDLCSALFLLATLCALTVREERSATGLAPKEKTEALNAALDAKTTLDKRSLPLAFLAGAFLWFMSHAAAASMWPNFMARLGYSKTAISSLWGLAALVEAPAMNIFGNLSDVVGRAPLLAAGSVGVALVMLGYVMVAELLPALIGVQVIRGLAYASFTASSMTFAVEWGEQHNRGSHTGLFNTATGGGQLLGLLLSGTIVQAAGFELFFGLCGLVALLSGVCFAVLHYRYRHVPVQPV